MTEEIGNSNLLRTWANDGTVVVPANAKIDEGWLRGEQPPHEWMNYIHNVLGQKVNHALSRGAADWNSSTEYFAGAIVNRNGDLWIALATNTDSAPTDTNTDWAAIYSRDNIVGTVSQVDGVPTGAVIERDSNDDGEYTRFADGTQICTKIGIIPNAFANGDVIDFDYPSAFASGSVVAGAMSMEGGTGIGIITENQRRFTVTTIRARPSRWTVNYFDTSSLGDFSQDVTVGLLATGRWF